MKSRFKRFGSAKVLKNLYRKHRLESGACFDSLGTLLPASLGVRGSGWGRRPCSEAPSAKAQSPETEKVAETPGSSEDQKQDMFLDIYQRLC